MFARLDHRFANARPLGQRRPHDYIKHSGGVAACVRFLLSNGSKLSGFFHVSLLNACDVGLIGAGRRGRGSTHMPLLCERLGAHQFTVTRACSATGVEAEVALVQRQRGRLPAHVTRKADTVDRRMILQ